MSRGRLLLGTLILVVGCGTADFQRLYEAERRVWKADQEYQTLSTQAAPAGMHAWKALAGRYESILQPYETEGDHVPSEPAKLAEILAHAWFRAAEAYEAALDSVRADELLDGLERRFQGIPDIAGRAALMQGQIAEARGEIDRAVDRYRTALDRLDPLPDSLQVAREVLELPLRVARLTVGESGDPPTAAAYAEASHYYERRIDDPNPWVQVEAQLHAAQIATDLGQWDQATQRLDELETRLRNTDQPSHEPAEVAFKAVSVQVEAMVYAHGSPDSVWVRLRALADRYPRNDVVPRALLAMARGLVALDRFDEAIACVDRLRREHQTSDEIPDAVLLKAQVLERQGQWIKAATVLEALPIEFPISRAALRAPLEMVRHYSRLGDADGTVEALTQAEEQYRAFLSRYPAGSHSQFAHEQLIETLLLQRSYLRAFQEILAYSRIMAGTAREPLLLVEAARVAQTDLADTTRAVAILSEAARRFSGTRVGTWSAREAARLQGDDGS